MRSQAPARNRFLKGPGWQPEEKEKQNAVNSSSGQGQVRGGGRERRVEVERGERGREERREGREGEEGMERRERKVRGRER